MGAGIPADFGACLAERTGSQTGKAVQLTPASKFSSSCRTMAAFAAIVAFGPAGFVFKRHPHETAFRPQLASATQKRRRLLHPTFAGGAAGTAGCQRRCRL